MTKSEKNRKIEKVLIANRGEPALRILRACKEMGIKTVMVHSTSDQDSLPVKFADESVCIGPPIVSKSYLNIPAIITAAELTNCDAVHPGMGFLAENADFASAVIDHDFIFIGPQPEHISLMGNKITAKHAAIDIGLPILPSTPVINDINQAYEFLDNNGYPAIIKAAYGGGGKGMRIIRNRADIEEGLSIAQSESRNAFGKSDCYIEKYLEQPRHYEVQIIGDMHGNLIHVGDRDCSAQIRYQKVVEEANVQYIDNKIRSSFLDHVTQRMKKLKYIGAGTLEFLYFDGDFYFMEMNTRLQVEHTVTECVSDIDIVREQINVAMGNQLSVKQEGIEIKGVSIECRINMQSSQQLGNKVLGLNLPSGPGVRVDTALYHNYNIPPYYDSMIAKIITYDSTREMAIARMKRALDETFIDGIATNITTLKDIISSRDFINNQHYAGWNVEGVK